MKSNVILIILGFIEVIFCSCDPNTTHDSNSQCPVEFFRRKRALGDYTQWLMNPDSTNEFLVKVLDEELTPPQSKSIVAVNIEPATKRGEKLIIGGVVLPSPTPMLTTGKTREYTRFVPPTVKVGVKGDMRFVAAVTPTPTLIDPIKPPLQPLQPQGYYTKRDESPPASPQFISRSPMLVARQYAPIEPVVFQPHPTLTTLLAPLAISNFHTFSVPTRTTYSPTTEKSNDIYEIGRYHNFEEEPIKQQGATRTSIAPKRTSVFAFTPALDNYYELATSKATVIEKSRRLHEEIEKFAAKDSDTSYNMMFYDNDDTTSSKKENKEIIYPDYDKRDTNDTDYERKDSNDTDYDRGGASDNTRDWSKPEEDENSKGPPNYIIEDYIINKMTAILTSNGTKNKSPSDSVAKPKAEKEKGKRHSCSLLKLRQLNFNSPRTLPEIVAQLKIWAESSPMAKWLDITNGNYTVMDNPIHMMIVDDLSSGQIITAKQTVMIVAGIQGRDHHAVTAALYVLYQLIERSESHADLLSKYRFWVIPVFNPDGYDYSMTFPLKREWSKNLYQQWDGCRGRQLCKYCDSYGLRCTVQNCYGVNLDRNFEYQWIPAEERQSEHPCGELYSGLRQLSEVETRALTHFLHEQRTPLATFIAFKEGEVLGIMYPYSHTKKRRSLDHIYRQRATKAAAAAYSISSRAYVAGQSSEFLPLYAGGMEDWVDSHLGIDNTYTIMMFRHTDSYDSKLITERVVQETYAAMDTLLLQSLEPLASVPPMVLLTGSGCRQKLPEFIYFIAVYFRLLMVN